MREVSLSCMNSLVVVMLFCVLFSIQKLNIEVKLSWTKHLFSEEFQFRKKTFFKEKYFFSKQVHSLKVCPLLKVFSLSKFYDTDSEEETMHLKQANSMTNQH